LLIRFHLESGARREGAPNLRLRDLDGRRSSVWLREKFGLEREQPLSPSLLRALEAHSANRGATVADHAVLRSRRGRPITRRRYNTVFDRARPCLGWAERTPVSAHVLRHTAITSVERYAGLDPNPALTMFRSDYRWLAQVYESVQPAGVSDALLWHRLGAKTLELVHGHITDLTVTGTGLDEVIVDAETIEAIRQLALPGVRIADDGPITLAEALDTIETRLRRRLESSGRHPVYVALSERLERLRRAQLDKASASIEFLREILELAQQVTAAERAEDEGGSGALSLLPEPNIGALTQIFREYAPADAPVILESVVADIDTIAARSASPAGTRLKPATAPSARRCASF
jgi:hypothetical protein